MRFFFFHHDFLEKLWKYWKTIYLAFLKKNPWIRPLNTETLLPISVGSLVICLLTTEQTGTTCLRCCVPPQLRLVVRYLTFPHVAASWFAERCYPHQITQWHCPHQIACVLSIRVHGLDGKRRYVRRRTNITRLHKQAARVSKFVPDLDPSVSAGASSPVVWGSDLEVMSWLALLAHPDPRRAERGGGGSEFIWLYQEHAN